MSSIQDLNADAMRSDNVETKEDKCPPADSASASPAKIQGQSPTGGMGVEPPRELKLRSQDVKGAKDVKDVKDTIPEEDLPVYDRLLCGIINEISRQTGNWRFLYDLNQGAIKALAKQQISDQKALDRRHIDPCLGDPIKWLDQRASEDKRIASLHKKMAAEQMDLLKRFILDIDERRPYQNVVEARH